MNQALVSTTALAGVPEFIEATSGTAAVAKVFRAEDVPESVVGRRGFFITHRAFSGILEQGARAAGDPDFGLMMAPSLDIRTWGPFGAYVTAGHTFIGALQRLMLALPYHGADDRMEMIASGDEIHFHQLQRRLGEHNLVFRDLALRTRLERAIELLRETDERISDIATALGYATPANFSRSFRHMFGVSPREVRKAGLVAAL